MSKGSSRPLYFEGSDGIVETECNAGEPILLAGLRQGLPLPYQCATGTCGECQAELVSGKVDVLWEQAPGAAKKKPGQLLMCQTAARERAVIRFKGKALGVHLAASSPQHQVARIDAVQVLSKDTAVVELRVARPFRYSGGQFVLVKIPEVSGFRAYSIGNFTSDHILRFIFRRKPGGKVTDWMFSGERVGTPVEIFGPLGRACLNLEQDRDLIMIVGGSGISVALGVIEHALTQKHFQKHSGWLFFGVRGPSDSFFGDVLEDYVRAAEGKLKVTIAFSEGSAPARLRQQYSLLEFSEGYVHEVAKEAMGKAANELTAFLAGPEPMVDGAIRTLVLSMGVPVTRIRYDKFT